LLWALLQVTTKMANLVSGAGRTICRRTLDPADSNGYLYLELTEVEHGLRSVFRTGWAVFFRASWASDLPSYERQLEETDVIIDGRYCYLLFDLPPIIFQTLYAGEPVEITLSAIHTGSTNSGMAATAVRSSPMPPGMGVGNKRKRANEEMGRNVKTSHTTDQDTNYAALLQGIDTAAGDESTRTAQAALAGAMDNAGYPEPGFDGGNGLTSAFGDTSPTGGDGSAQYGTPGQNSNKPAVGSQQWHQQRKENHKEGKFCRLSLDAMY
jgi:hypothetical protein